MRSGFKMGALVSIQCVVLIRKDLVGQLADSPLETLEGRVAVRRTGVHATYTPCDCLASALQKTGALEAVQQRIQGARADRVPVSRELLRHPGPVDRHLGGVVQDVHAHSAPDKVLNDIHIVERYRFPIRWTAHLPPATKERHLPMVTVRYIVRDVDEAIAFYCQHLGFREIMHPATTFAMVSRDDLRLVLSAPSGQGGGGQSMPDGTQPEPGGWNRFSLEVSDLQAQIATLREAGIQFRNNMVTGVGGNQVLIDDPSGNPVELFEPTIPEAHGEP